MSRVQAEAAQSPGALGGEVLRVEDLRVWFPLRRSITELITMKPQRFVKAVDGVSFSIARGEVFCLVGESGCGKTTTGKAILRLVKATGGRVFFKPKKEVLEELERRGVKSLGDGFIDLLAVPRRKFKPLRRELQIVYQDPYGSLNPRFTIKRILEDPLLIHGIGNAREREEMVARMLEAVKLTPASDFMDRYPHQLSGGQRQRVAIARAFILNPSLVVADEPVSMLDVSIRAEILELLLGFREKLGTSLLFITHDLAVARYICDRIAVMYLGKIVETGDARRIIERPIHPYTKALVAAIPEPDPSNRKKLREVPIKGEVPSAAAIPPGCRFHPRCVEYEQYMDRLREMCPVKEPPLKRPTEGEEDRRVSCWRYIPWS
ncbi:oligopeptide ABC transporter, ATP binding protein [Aeropyrum pernix]|uniref:Oligopeptide ABC transporter, ATP binding protein n=1 Tax=Aeropyrum pernix TaxID=56636 RepID=A0A401H8A6_AERPX|nr:ABC transporter ATP-binding protein [Aeropyrum pernix]GBF08572.1 oligopeptide ABC transporter, ATP binding protein [Aeropyrum pernix]